MSSRNTPSYKPAAAIKYIVSAAVHQQGAVLGSPVGHHGRGRGINRVRSGAVGIGSVDCGVSCPVDDYDGLHGIWRGDQSRQITQVAAARRCAFA